MSLSPRLVYAARAELAEGPVWHRGALWWVDIVVGTLNRLDVETGVNTSRATGGFLGCAVPCTDGRWLLARQHECVLLDWDTGRTEQFLGRCPGVLPRHRFNDGKCDPLGRFWAGTMSLDRAQGETALFSIEPSGETRRVLEGLSLSNGLGWTGRGDVFFHVDTPTRRIVRYRFDPASGTVAEPRVLIEFEEKDGWPDGLTCDAEGHLWVGLFGGGALVRVHGEEGRILERVPMPVSNVTSCTFGGADLSTLYITTAWEGFSLAQREAEPLAGSIFSLRVETPGCPVVPFALASSRR